MKIILSGGGSPDIAEPIDRYFANVIDHSQTVLYIPVAMEAHVFTYEQCFSWFRNTYGGYGIRHAEMCTDLQKLQLDQRYTAVFIGGGNTFKLLHEIRQSNFAEQLTAYLESGGILYGGSAGAIICGKTIEPAQYEDQNDLQLQNLAGLNLLQDYDVFCHYDPSRHFGVLRELQRKLYVLYEASGLVLDGGTVTSIGEPFVECGG